MLSNAIGAKEINPQVRLKIGNFGVQLCMQAHYSNLLFVHLPIHNTHVISFITGSAVALHCCKAHSKSIEKWKIRPPVKL